ncbi:MAG: hypothetical protein NXI31_02595 [bacterium]|nr:hypothetical protein [bacterium]
MSCLRGVLGSCILAAALAAQSPDPWPAAFTFENVPIPAGIDPQIGGLDALPDGRLAICFHRGEVMIFDPASGAWQRFAEGLHEPLGLLVESAASLLVMQRAELTRLRDTDGDGQADDYETVYDGFGMTGNYHEFAFGPARDAAGNLYVALNTASNGAGVREEIRGAWSPIGLARDKMTARGRAWEPFKQAAGRMYARAAWRGWVVKLSPDGETATPFACGFRSPDGIGFDAEGRLLVTDNQGDWLGTSKVHHVKRGGFYGHVASLVWRPGWTRNPLEVPVAELDELRMPAMGLLPHGELANSPTQPVAIPAGVFGPLARQTLIGDMDQHTLVRFLPDPVAGVSQGAAIPFLQTAALGRGNHRMTFTADGSLWIGKTHLSWAGAEGLVRVRWRGAAAGLFAVDRVRVTQRGFVLGFTEPVAAASLGGVRVRAHRYHYHKAYGSPKVDDHAVAVVSNALDESGTTLVLEFDELPADSVYTFQLDGLTSRRGRALLGDRIYYTLLRAR